MKVFLVFMLSMLMVAGVAFAVDDVSTIDQTGAGNEATVTQNTGTLNDSDIDQVGDDNAATVNQNSGNANESDVIQGLGGYESYNGTANVDQVGSSNISKTRMIGSTNVTDIDQSDNANDSDVDQIGDDNSATVNQNSGQSNISAVKQGTVADPSNNGTVNVDQVGWINYSTIEQYGSDQVADVDQTGNYNDSNINQSGSTPGSSATVIQNGDYDYSDIVQFSSGGGLANTATVTQGETVIAGQSSDYNHWSEIDQNGQENTANVTQDGNNEFSFVDQDGDENTATVDQSGATLNDSWIYQNGDSNTAETTQDGTSNDATINQHLGAGSATNNSARLKQDNSADNNTAVITQDLDGNKTLIVQRGGQFNQATFTSNSDDNGLRTPIGPHVEGNVIWQLGNANTATVNQLTGAGDNTAWVEQDGNDFATVNQDGFQNDAYVVQQ